MEAKNTSQESNAVYQALRTISMTDKQREEIMTACEEAYKLTPQEPIESTKVAEDKVICKMMLKGFPKALLDTVERILMPLQVKNKNGYVDYEKTNQYVITILLEKV